LEIGEWSISAERRAPASASACVRSTYSEPSEGTAVFSSAARRFSSAVCFLDAHDFSGAPASEELAVSDFSHGLFAAHDSAFSVPS
jgi:hypothetical protein